MYFRRLLPAQSRGQGDNSRRDGAIVTNAEVGHTPLTVAVVSDRTLLGHGLQLALRDEGGLRVAGGCLASTGAVEALRLLRPDVVLLDLGVAHSSTALIPVLVGELPHARVLALVDSDDDGAAVRALQAGASGVATFGAGLPQLLALVQQVADGHLGLSTDHLARLVRGAGNHGAEVDLMAFLTSREREVLVLLTEGRSTADIASDLLVSVNTVRTHVQNVLSKLGVHSKLEAAAYAVRHR